MSRVYLSAQVAVVAILSLTRAGISLAEAGPPVRPELAQKQLVSATNCQTAAHAQANPNFLSKGAEYRDDVHITTRYCSATAHNQLTPTKAEIVVVGADPNATSDNKIFIKTVSKSAAKKLHDVCVLAGKATFAYLQAPPTATQQSGAAADGANVLTSSGKVDCEGFLGATDAANPLVVLAPSAFSGFVTSVHILNMIGLKKPATEVQAAVDNLHHQVAGSAATSDEEIRKRPQIVLESPGQN